LSKSAAREQRPTFVKPAASQQARPRVREALWASINSRTISSSGIAGLKSAPDAQLEAAEHIPGNLAGLGPGLESPGPLGRRGRARRSGRMPCLSLLSRFGFSRGQAPEDPGGWPLPRFRSPKKAGARGFRGIVQPHRGRSLPNRGLAQPNCGWDRPNRGTDQRFRGREGSYRGTVERFRGILRPYRGTDQRFRGREGSYRGTGQLFRGTDQLSRGTAQLFRGTNASFPFWDLPPVFSGRDKTSPSGQIHIEGWPEIPGPCSRARAGWRGAGGVRFRRLRSAARSRRASGP
jgi:hypothetical protein